MSSNKVIDSVFAMMKDSEAQFVDLRFTDTLGKEQHVSMPVSVVDDEFFEHGRMFDGSSIKGWQQIHESDLKLLPDANTAVVDPFCETTTINIRCDVINPMTGEGYARDPRCVAKKAEAYLRETGIADTCYMGPEPEFFIFDDVRWRVNINGAFYEIDSEEAAWNSGKVIEGGNYGHRPSVKGGYFPVPPVDSSQDLRAAMSMAMEAMGLSVEAHHHEVATSNQNEIATRFNSLLLKADELQIYKYVVHNVAHHYGKTATFMPKPVVGDNGNGMHCHQSLWKDGKNVFAGDQYAGLSEEALYYIGGILAHGRALSFFTNPTTNSYKRLVPGFEAPVLLTYSSRNRSAAIRVPHSHSDKTRRVEVRFPDPMANPYFAFSAMLMAGLDGIKNKIHPGEAIQKDLYSLPAEELAAIPTISQSLGEAIEAVKADHEFLLAGDVFTEDTIHSYIDLKQAEIQRLVSITHPVEFEMYYSN